MTCPCSRSRFYGLRQLCLLCCLLAGFCSLPAARAQNLDKPLQNIDEDITAFTFAPDGRIVYSVYRRLKTKAYDALEHDDIWLQDASGKRRRLLEGQKYTRGSQVFSYLIDSFRFSPNGRFILAQLLTTTVDSDSGNGVDSYQTLVFDDSGREIRIAKGDNVILDAANATFLPDNATIFYLSEALKPLPIFAIKSTRLATGSFPSFYEGRTFRDVVWLKNMNFAIAVEQDRSLSGPPRLQHLDLFSDDHEELATLDGYESGLSVSPSGKKVAYFIDKEVLEIRDLASPARVARIRIGLGIYRWSPDESRILFKRSLEKKSGDLAWIDLPPLAAPAKGQEVPVSQPEPSTIFRGITFRQFDISPDGRFLAVTMPGKRNLLVFPLPR